MKRYLLAMLLLTIMLVATAAPALAAGPFSITAPPGAAPGNFVRSGTADQHDMTIHPTGHNNQPAQCQASFCTTTTTP